jgi:hypothetical protein
MTSNPDRVFFDIVSSAFPPKTQSLAQQVTAGDGDWGDADLHLGKEKSYRLNAGQATMQPQDEAAQPWIGYW